MQNTLIDISERMDRLEKGKIVNTTYSTKDLTPSSAAPTSTVNVKFGMPPNYFAGCWRFLKRQFTYHKRTDRGNFSLRVLPQDLSIRGSEANRLEFTI